MNRPFIFGDGQNLRFALQEVDQEVVLEMFQNVLRGNNAGGGNQPNQAGFQVLQEMLGQMGVGGLPFDQMGLAPQINTGNGQVDDFINDAQNTHAHRTNKEIDATVKRLLTHYPKIDVKKVHADILEAIEKVQDDRYFRDKYPNMRQCFFNMTVTGFPQIGNGIFEMDGLKVTDRLHGVTVGHMLALIWVSLHDPDTFNPGNAKFTQQADIDKQWEIDKRRRRDTLFNALDRIIRENVCPGGTFNNLVDAINGATLDAMNDYAGTGALQEEAKKLAKNKAYQLAKKELLKRFFAEPIINQASIVASWDSLEPGNSAETFYNKVKEKVRYAVMVEMKKERIDDALRTQLVNEAIDNLEYLPVNTFPSADSLDPELFNPDNKAILNKISAMLDIKGADEYQKVKFAFDHREVLFDVARNNPNMSAKGLDILFKQTLLRASIPPFVAGGVGKSNDTAPLDHKAIANSIYLNAYLCARGFNDRRIADLKEKVSEVTMRLQDCRVAANSMNNQSDKTLMCRQLDKFDTLFRAYLRDSQFAYQSTQRFVRQGAALINDLCKCQNTSQKIKYALTNLLIALSGIGLIILGIKAIHSYAVSKRVTLFNHPVQAMHKPADDMVKTLVNFS